MDRQAKQIEGLTAESGRGAEAQIAFNHITEAFLSQKADIMDLFENCDTLQVEELQEAHRKYRAIVKLEDYFVSKITAGDQSRSKLNRIEDRK